MKPTLPSLVAAAFVAAALPHPAAAQVEVSISLGLPVRPAFVVVQPGVRVVEDYEEEVFLVSGVYWLRRGPDWYRAPRRGVAFVRVPPPRVPVALVRLPPPGHYKHWRKEQAKAERRAAKDEHGRGRGRGHGRH